MLRRILSQFYHDSPKANLAKLRSRMHGAAEATRQPPDENKVISGLLECASLAKLLAHSAAHLSHPGIVLAGGGDQLRPAIELLRARGRSAEIHEWTWGTPPAAIATPGDAAVILGLLPATEAHWQEIAGLKKHFGSRLHLLTELLLPYTRLTFLQSRLDYYLRELDRILPFYLGEKFFGPLDRLDALFPLRGRRIIEFGPFDGCQTAGLAHFGSASVTCIEARAENVTKTRTAAEVFDWPQVRVVMDDFHNADGTKYGRYDLAFAHGVYYHSVAPFVFLENLRSLSDAIFLGGFCATDTLPASPWMELHHEGRSYRAKLYRETDGFTAGVNSVAYFFHADDLMRFFSERAYTVQVVSDEEKPETAGRFIRFLATRR